MTKLAGMASGPVLGAAGVAAIAAAVGLYVSGVLDPEPSESLEPAALLSGETSIAPEATEDAEPDVVETVAVEPEAELVTAETPAADAPAPPSIDTFRLEPDGSMLIAGQAHPDWATSVTLDGNELEQVTPDASGQFVAFLTVEASDQPRVLSLITRNPETDELVASLDEVIIAPTSAAVAALDDPSTPTEQETQPGAEIVVADPEPTETPATEDTEATQTVLLSDESGVRVVQPSLPLSAAPEVMSSVALDTISYSEAGEVQLSGRGQGAGFVRVYLDNAPVTTSRIEEDGNWRTDLPEVDTGVYTLRIDETDAEGNVTSRVETPFKREDEEVLSDAAALENQRVSAVTVQPGSTLWAISRDRYGEGTLYVRVFEANRDRIRDPDLIYPGQVFNLPE